MEQVDLSVIQNKAVRVEFRQGVGVVIDLAILDGDLEPIEDIDSLTFLAQIRDAYAKDSGNLILEFSLTPDQYGNFYSIDTDAALLRFTLGHVTSQSLTPNRIYHFECKTINADNLVVDSMQLSLLARPDIARAVIV